MSNGPGIRVNLIIVTALVSLVTKEVDGGVFDSARVLCIFLEMLKAVCLIPSSREDVEGDLTTDRVSVPPIVLASIPYQ